MGQIAVRYDARSCHEVDNEAPGETVRHEAGFSCEVMLIVIALLYNVLGYEMVVDHDENAIFCYLVVRWGMGTETTTDDECLLCAGSGMENMVFRHLVLRWGMGTETTIDDEGPLCAGFGIENVIFCHLVHCWGMGTETTVDDDEGPLCVGSGIDLDVRMVKRILLSWSLDDLRRLVAIHESLHLQHHNIQPGRQTRSLIVHLEAAIGPQDSPSASPPPRCRWRPTISFALQQ